MLKSVWVRSESDLSQIWVRSSNILSQIWSCKWRNTTSKAPLGHYLYSGNKSFPDMKAIPIVPWIDAWGDSASYTIRKQPQISHFKPQKAHSTPESYKKHLVSTKLNPKTTKSAFPAESRLLSAPTLSSREILPGPTTWLKKIARTAERRKTRSEVTLTTFASPSKTPQDSTRFNKVVIYSCKTL